MQNKNVFLIMFIGISMYAMEEKESHCLPAAVEIDPLRESIEKHAYSDWKIKKDVLFRGSHSYNIVLSQTRAQYKGADQIEKTNDIDEKKNNDAHKN